MMRAFVAVVAATATIASWPLFRPSNSKQSTAEGTRAFAAGRFSDAAAAFDAAAAAAPGEIASFNRGTAKLAAGDGEGAAILRDLAASPQPVGGDALFNLGNGALAAQRWDDAIARYETVLRRSPSDADAKRNLEIALRRKETEQRQRGERSRPEPRGGAGKENEEPQPAPAGGGEGKESMTPDEILRSIAQQEKEELRRMRREKGGEARPIGW